MHFLKKYLFTTLTTAEKQLKKLRNARLEADCTLSFSHKKNEWVSRKVTLAVLGTNPQTQTPVTTPKYAEESIGWAFALVETS